MPGRLPGETERAVETVRDCRSINAPPLRLERSASITTTTLHHAMCSRRSSAPRSISPRSAVCRSSSTLVRRRPTRFASSKRAGCRRGVFHCFTGDLAMAQQALDLGFYLSFAGIVTFPKAQELRERRARDPDRHGCSAKRMHRTWRRFRSAASATSRPMSRALSRPWRICTVCTRDDDGRAASPQFHRSLRLIRLSATA